MGMWIKRMLWIQDGETGWGDNWTNDMKFKLEYNNLKIAKYIVM